MLGALLTVPVNIVIETSAVLWGLFGTKHKFYVVNKETNSCLREKVNLSV